MPPRRTATAARRSVSVPSALTSGSAVLLAGGGEAIFLREEGENAALRVGTGHPVPYWAPLEGLTPVDEAEETERHAKFRADALRRGEIEA